MYTHISMKARKVTQNGNILSKEQVSKAANAQIHLFMSPKPPCDITFQVHLKKKLEFHQDLCMLKYLIDSKNQFCLITFTYLLFRLKLLTGLKIPTEFRLLKNIFWTCRNNNCEKAISWKSIFWKNEKKCLEILSFYTSVPYMTIIWCIVSEIWNATYIIFCHFVPFFALLPL